MQEAQPRPCALLNLIFSYLLNIKNPFEWLGLQCLIFIFSLYFNKLLNLSNEYRLNS